MRKMVFLSCALMVLPAFGQTMYKCPAATAGAPAVYQQMPCSPTGGGEAMAAKPIKSTGVTAEVSKEGQEYMKANQERWAAQAEQAEKDRIRDEDLRIERAKIKAAQDQAAAQRATAAAIWARGR